MLTFAACMVATLAMATAAYFAAVRPARKQTAAEQMAALRSLWG